MKKTLAIILSLVLCIGLLAACGGEASDPTEAPEAPESEAPATEPAEEVSGNVHPERLHLHGERHPRPH